MGAKRGWTESGNPAGRCGLVSAEGKALARCDTDNGHDAHSDSGGAQWQGRRVDGKSNRRTVSRYAQYVLTLYRVLLIMSRKVPELMLSDTLSHENIDTRLARMNLLFELEEPNVPRRLRVLVDDLIAKR